MTLNSISFLREILGTKRKPKMEESYGIKQSLVTQKHVIYQIRVKQAFFEIQFKDIGEGKPVLVSLRLEKIIWPIELQKTTDRKSINK